MKFDCTKGKEARYLVNVYGWNVEDKYYYHSADAARKCFESLRASETADTSIAIRDLETGKRIAFAVGQTDYHAAAEVVRNMDADKLAAIVEKAVK